jgi:membrane dipeptidase
LQRLPDLLAARGFSETDIAGVMHGNFLRHLRAAWGRSDAPLSSSGV